MKVYEICLDNEFAHIGRYTLTLYDRDKELENIHIIDNTNEWCKNRDKENKWFRDYAYEVCYCNGFSMNRGYEKMV